MKKYNIDEELIIGINTPKKKGASNKKLAPKKNNKNNKKNKVNKNKVKIIVRCTSLIILIAFVIIFLMISPVFNITTIEVTGNETLSNEKIISLSEIQLGENIFRLSGKKIREKIKSNAYVDTVDIKRKLPNGINIVVKERTARYMLEYADGFVYVNSQGYMIDLSGERKEIPILTGCITETANMIVGNRIDIEDLNKLSTANKIMKEANSNEIDSIITKIDISDEENYKLIIESEGKTVYLGNCSDITTRIARLKAVLEKTGGREGEIFIDGNTASQNPIFRERID